jgi:hypothetical protein
VVVGRPRRRRRDARGAIAPEPEEGESRLVAGDLVFLLIVAMVVAGLAWLGARLAGRFARPA